MNINGYILKEKLKNANSGFSKWGFAVKNDKEYFIKELINPVYPIDKSVMSEELFQEKRDYCLKYEIKFKHFFELINKASRGNLVRIIEFFRCGSRYYLISEKVEEKSPSMEYISSLDDEKKLLLLKSVAYCFYDLHSVGIVHSDVKPNNILVKTTKNGNYVAKLIDFDSGFLKGDVLENKELGGELTYLAPETFLAIYGEDVHPDEKADIFGLGLVFHEYYCGTLPDYNKNEYEYPYEAALDGSTIKLNTDILPDELAELITSMLDADPKKRPSAEDIISEIDKLCGYEKLPQIRSISIHFNGHYGKSISVQSGKIKYKNTLHPTIAPQTVNFPASYTATHEKSITEAQFENIVNKISEAGLADMIGAPPSNTPLHPGAVYEGLIVVYKDGTTYEYSPRGTSASPFKKIAEILSEYCDFPQINPDWYGTNISPCKKQENNDWFKPAGDL